MNGDLYEVTCSKFKHKISNCPYFERVSSCVNCPYARFLKRDVVKNKSEEETVKPEEETIDSEEITEVPEEITEVPEEITEEKNDGK
jgi:hypothetical protein